MIRYENIVRAKFVDRPNRFIALAEINGHIEKAHVMNTGRCRELLIPGTDIFLQRHDDPKRKTKYSLITVCKDGNILVNVDSQVPNALAAGMAADGRFLPGTVNVRREKVYGDSRYDLYVRSDKQEMFIEVKGVTLNEDGVARFPDAPTQRGLKHVRGLIQAVADGYGAALVFMIQMKGVTVFEPNMRTQPEFGAVLCEARDAGVQIRAFDCIVTPDSIEADKEIPVRLPD